MIPPQAHWSAPLEALLAALDESVALQEAVLAHLESAAEAVLHFREEALREEVDRQATMPARLQEAARHRHAARSALADALGWAVEEVTLGRLQAELPEPEARRVGRRRERLLALSQAVRRRHLRTAVLVGEAARIRRSLLDALAPAPTAGSTYRTDGRRVSATGDALLDARR